MKRSLISIVALALCACGGGNPDATTTISANGQTVKCDTFVDASGTRTDTNCKQVASAPAPATNVTPKASAPANTQPPAMITTGTIKVN